MTALERQFAGTASGASDDDDTAPARLLRRAHAFKTLVEHSPDAIARLDRQLRHLYVNPGTEAAFGLPANAYLGKSLAELGLPDTMVHAWETAARQVFDDRGEQRFEFQFARDGAVRHFSVRLIPERDPRGCIESILGISYDVTEQHRMEQERASLLARERSARIQAETSARARDEFLAIVSHELRAPLNGIQSWAHILENYVTETASAPLAQRALAGIKTGIAQQVRLIEDLLDVTRIVSGKLRLVRQPLALLPVLQAALASVRSHAAAKEIDLDCAFEITAEQISGDCDRVQQIFWNLLSNAIKFTPQGGKVWIEASPHAGGVRVMVRDNGIGISPEFLPQLFDRFSQEDTSSTRGHAGLGLGLFLVRHLIELHGGAIEVDSAGNGLGTCFTVYLPLAGSHVSALTGAVDDADAGRLPSPSLAGCTILLVDDQLDARDAFSAVLQSAGADVHAAGSAQDAMAWLRTRTPVNLPHMLVCDIAMPHEDGYTALKRIRNWEIGPGQAPLKHLPALAVTAFSQREDRLRALAAGFQMHMSKPVAPTELIVVAASMMRCGA